MSHQIQQMNWHCFSKFDFVKRKVEPYLVKCSIRISTSLVLLFYDDVLFLHYIFCLSFTALFKRAEQRNVYSKGGWVNDDRSFASTVSLSWSVLRSMSFRIWNTQLKKTQNIFGMRFCLENTCQRIQITVRKIRLKKKQNFICFHFVAVRTWQPFSLCDIPGRTGAEGLTAKLCKEREEMCWSIF